MGEYSVYQFFVDDSQETVLRFVGAEAAVDCFYKLIRSVGAKLGTTKRVIVTDGGDCTNMEWVHGKGVVYPPEVAAKWNEMLSKDGPGWGAAQDKVNEMYEDGSDLLDAADAIVKADPVRPPAKSAEAYAGYKKNRK